MKYAIYTPNKRLLLEECKKKDADYIGMRMYGEPDLHQIFEKPKDYYKYLFSINRQDGSIPKHHALWLKIIHIDDMTSTETLEELPQTQQTFNVALIKKENNKGLTKQQCMQLYDKLDETYAYPIDVFDANIDISAHGFITATAAANIHFDYAELDKAVEKILKEQESIAGETTPNHYRFGSLYIYLENPAEEK